MPQLKWNELNLFEFLCCEPVVGDYGVSHDYELVRNELRLSLRIKQLESLARMSLFNGSSNVQLFAFAAFVRGEVRLMNDRRGRFVDFEDCVIAPESSPYFSLGDPFDRPKHPFSVTVRLEVDPDIRIAFLNHETRT